MVCILSYTFSRPTLLLRLLKQNKTHFFHCARQYVGTMRTRVKCLMLKRPQWLQFQCCNEVQDECCFHVCWTEWGHMCCKVPVCLLSCKAQTSYLLLRWKKRGWINRVYQRILRYMAETNPPEENPQEPLMWRTAKHLTLSLVDVHSAPPSLFTRSSNPSLLF